MNANIYLSSYETSKEERTEKLKSYAFFKLFSETSKMYDNLVIASNNELFVSFNGQSDSKVFLFDKVFQSDILQMDQYDSIFKPVLQDVMMGFNCFLIVCDLQTPPVPKSVGCASASSTIMNLNTIVSRMFKELLMIVKAEESMDSSLYISHFAVRGNKIIDFLSVSNDYKDLKIFASGNQCSFFEIKDLSEKPLISESDVAEIFSNVTPCGIKCFFGCCHTSSILTATVKKSVHSNGFELMKSGKLTVVNFTECQNNILLDEMIESFSPGNEKVLGRKCEFLSIRNKLTDLLEPAFGGYAKTTLLVNLSPVLNSPEKDMGTLQFVSQARKIVNHPRINEKLIMRDSIKEYSDDIEELQKDLNEISNGSGVMLDELMYRSYKISTTVEDEKLKLLKNHLQSLSESLNMKKQNVRSLHRSSELVESEKRETEKCSANSRFQLEELKIKHNTRSERISKKAEEILKIESERKTCKINSKKLKSEITKAEEKYCELLQSLQNMKESIEALSSNMDAEWVSFHCNIIMLKDEINDISSNLKTMQNGLFTKLNSLPSMDRLLQIWTHSTDDLLSKFSCFFRECNRKFNAIRVRITSTLVPLQKLMNEMLQIIRNNRTEKCGTLSYSFHKIQNFSDFALKVLTEMKHQLCEIHAQTEAEVNTLRMVLNASSEALKLSVRQIYLYLTQSKQIFDDLEKKLVQMTDAATFHHNFKKQFDENFGNIKYSLFALKQMCLSHTDAVVHRWSEVESTSVNSALKFADINKMIGISSLIQNEMSKYCDQLSQAHSSSLEHSRLKAKTENRLTSFLASSPQLGNRTNQLLQKHKEITIEYKDASETNKKITDKEQLEISRYMDSQNSEDGKDFENCSLKLMTFSRSVHDELKSIQQDLSNKKEDLKKNLNDLSSSVGDLIPIFNSCVSTSESILGKSGEVLNILPECSNSSYCDTLLELDISMGKCQFQTSTPKNAHAREQLNMAAEKERLLKYIKSIVEQSVSQNSCCSDSGLDKRTKKNNISSMSLPNLNSHSMMDQGTRKNLTKFKSHKK